MIMIDLDFKNRSFDEVARSFIPKEAWYLMPEKKDPIELAYDLARRCRALGTNFFTTHVTISYRVRQVTGSHIEGMNIASAIMPYFWAWLTLEETRMVLGHKNIADTCLLVYEEGFAMLDGKVASSSILDYLRKRKEVYSA